MSIETTSEFKLEYRELVCQDRGQIFDLYHFSSILSRSNYSIIRKVTSRGSLQHRICKIIPLSHKDYFSVISEVEFLKKLDHPNIIQIIEYFIESAVLYIILEEIPGNKILSELNKIKDGINFNSVVEIMKQILSAMEYCHHK
jgi:serine/threonine protein kinase